MEHKTWYNKELLCSYSNIKEVAIDSDVSDFQVRCLQLAVVVDMMNSNVLATTYVCSGNWIWTLQRQTADEELSDLLVEFIQGCYL